MATVVTPAYLPNLRHMAEHWTGTNPISVAVYLASPYTADDLSRLLSHTQLEVVKAKAEIHLVDAIEGKPFPINSLRNVAIEHCRGRRTILLEADMVMPISVQNFFGSPRVEAIELTPETRFSNGQCGEKNGGQVCGCQPESSDTYCSEAGWCGNSAAHQAKHQVDFSCGGKGSAKPDCPKRSDGTCRLGWILPIYRAVAYSEG